jgi:hypothetical protein
MTYRIHYQGPSIHSFDLEQLLQLVDDVPLETWQTMWALCDRAYAHYTHNVMQYFDSHYLGRLRERNGPGVASIIIQSHSC